MISGTNQSKNIVTPYGQRKSGVYFWGDSVASWGDSLATWGNLLITPTNQSKSTVPTTTIPAGSPIGLLLALTYAHDVTIGSSVVNQSKS